MSGIVRQTGKVLYHDTSEAGYRGILESMSILPSLKADNPKDARYGDGQYFSDIVPNTKRPGQLSRIFFGHPFSGNRFTHFVSIEVGDLKVVPGRSNVFVIKNTEPFDITDRLKKHGKL